MGDVELSFDITHTDYFQAGNGLRGWGAENGKAILQRFVLTEAPAKLTANGTLGVDRNGHLDGGIDTTLIKPGNFIAMLDRSGALKATQKDALTTGLAMSALAGGGKTKTLFEFRDGQVFANGTRVADLPAYP